MQLFDNPDDTFENHRMVMEEMFEDYDDMQYAPDPETLCENDGNIGEWSIEREFEPTDKLLCGICFLGYYVKKGEVVHKVSL